MKLKPGTPLHVKMRFAPGKIINVGRLAMDRGVALLEYAAPFVESGLPLNPLFAPPALGQLLQAKNPRDFDGLHGVFGHSLPDAWGLLLIQRRAEAHGIAFLSLNALDLLSVVRHRGPGALIYEPEIEVDDNEAIDLDVIAAHAIELADGGEPIEIDQLERLGGPSGGARPKILVGIGAGDVFVPGDSDLQDGYEHWIIKFRSSKNDFQDIGPLEAAYADMARAAGVEMSPTRLLVGRNDRYFATKRFDRLPDNRRLHMLSAAALLDIAWDVPSIDYDQLLRLTRYATRDQRAVEAMFRRMIFNVLAHNRDDHPNQHAFLMDDAGRWTLAPAYDLTFNRGPGNQHYLAVGGHGGDDIVRADIDAISQTHDITTENVTGILEQVSAAVADFPSFAEANGVSKQTVNMVNPRLQDVQKRLSIAAPTKKRARARG